METINNSKNESQDNLQLKQTGINYHQAEAINGVEKSVRAALETYSNVHRGSGHASMATIHKAKERLTS